jgi:hypothetical protein
MIGLRIECFRSNCTVIISRSQWEDNNKKKKKKISQQLLVRLFFFRCCSKSHSPSRLHPSVPLMKVFHLSHFHPSSLLFSPSFFQCAPVLGQHFPNEPNGRTRVKRIYAFCRFIPQLIFSTKTESWFLLSFVPPLSFFFVSRQVVVEATGMERKGSKPPAPLL